MKRRTFSICFACGLAFSASLHAANEMLRGDPYEPIVARNIFDLNPPQAVDTKPDVTPPAKITVNGIMTILGKKQVLYKVMNPPAPGKPAKEVSYILTEGQRQDDIEVAHIDEANGIITFNNHGIVQEIPLTSAPALNAPVAAGKPGPVPVLPTIRPPVAAGNFNRMGNRPGNIRESINNRNFGNGNGGPSFNNTPSRNVSVNSGSTESSTTQTQPQITPEEQIIMMEVNRQTTAEQVEAGELPPLPPTELTPPGAPGYVPPSQGEQK